MASVMALRNRPYLLFLVAAFVAFGVGHIILIVKACVWIGQEDVNHAACEALYFVMVQPLEAAFLLIPFLLLGWIAASLATKQNWTFSTELFGVGACAVLVLYWLGHVGAQQAIKNLAWTAAAFLVGLIPFKSVQILVVVFLASLLFGKKRHAKEI